MRALPNLQIENLLVSELSVYENNSKLHPDSHINAIIKSIEDFGFNDPIAVDENKVIIEGHGRYQAAIKLGMAMVPCIRLNGLTETQRRGYILAHNKLCMNTGFDLQLLNQELDFLKEQNYEFNYLEFNDYVQTDFVSQGVTIDPVADQAAELMRNTAPLREQTHTDIKFNVPNELKAGFANWVLNSLVGTEYEGRVIVK